MPSSRFHPCPPPPPPPPAACESTQNISWLPKIKPLFSHTAREGKFLAFWSERSSPEESGVSLAANSKPLLRNPCCGALELILHHEKGSACFLGLKSVRKQKDTHMTSLKSGFSLPLTGSEEKGLWYPKRLPTAPPTFPARLKSENAPP